ncbi:ABC transporter substrate-binding protein [Lacticaseibacillus casei]|nr:ABC transporter substrate-binding protein [Lacticaseibacillus casei]NIG82586.1 ABC transporter substrate-binding protein [Lacticaseibacillus casei]PTU99103.1 ABC transporter substrate-binding protein [Lacticaseibacillus casei]PTV00137.1 ABC transporter substrate-binding protein [Lacticaseibacillus casei]RXS58940.1 ABC transporter substrate-binding protein [Lacticaseibacillus casei]
MTPKATYAPVSNRPRSRSALKRDPPPDLLIRVAGLLLFSRERKSHMDEFVHVAVNCK